MTKTTKAVETIPVVGEVVREGYQRLGQPLIPEGRSQWRSLVSTGR